jgi:hypothetical protein
MRTGRVRLRRGASYVEILVIVSVVLVLGLLAVKLVGQGADEKAEKEASCIRSFGCAGGRGGGGPVPIPGAGGAGSGAGGASSGGSGAGGAGGASSGGSGAGSGSGSGGGFIASIKNGVTGSWQWFQTSKNPFVAFTRGAGSELTGQVQTIAFLVMHPIKAAEGVWFSVTHPIQTVKAMASQWGDRSLSENLGHLTVMVGEALTGTLEAKAGTVAAGAAQKVSEIATAGSVAAKARVVGELALDVAAQTTKSYVKGRPKSLPQTGSTAKDKADKAHQGKTTP